METKNLQSMNQLIRCVSGANLNLFRFAAMVLVLLTLGIGNAWGSSNYYASLQINEASGKPTGAGSVYVSKTTTKPSANPGTTIKSDATTTSGGSRTFYYWIDVNAGYNVQLSGDITKAYGTITSGAQNSVALNASTSKNGTKAYTATATFVAVTVNSVDAASKDLAPTNPSIDYPFTVTFATSNLKTIALDLNKSPETADGKFTITSWAQDGNNVVATGKFNGGDSYGGASRNNSTTVSLQSKASGSAAKTCTVTANFPAMAFVSVEADDVFATQGESGKTGSATFKYNYAAEDDFPTTPTLTPTSGTGTFTVTGYTVTPDFAKGETTVTVNYSFDTNNGIGETPATLTLTAANGDVRAVTVTGHSEAMATNDASVTTTANVTTEYATFAAALAAANATSGDTLKLLRDVDLGTITATNNINKAMTIDLNGKELRAAVNAKQVGVLTVNANVVVTIKDSKTGGRIINEYGKNDVLYTINVAKGTLNLESGTISIHNTLQQSYGTAAAGGVATSVVAMGARAIQQAAATTVNINGGRVESYGTRAVYGIRTEGSKANTTTLNISGGEIYAESPAYVYAVFSNGKLNVSGGTITAKINNEVVNENTAYMEYIRTNNKLWDNRTYGLRGFGYGILLQGGNSVTANANYFGTLNMTGGTVNVINVGDPETQANSTVTSIIQSPLYGVYFNAAALNVKTGTASDGSYSQKYAAKGSITGGKVNVTNNGRQSYGVWVTGNYNSFDNSYVPVELKNCTINVSSYYESYGVYATAVVGTTSDNASPNMGACYAGEVELTGATVTAETTTAATAYALFAHAVVGNVYKNATWTKAKNAGYPRVYDGEFGAAAKITVNSGTYTATSATTTAYAVGSTTRAKTTLSSETSVAANRELGGNAEAYPVLILHGGTFRGETGTTTSGAVLSGGYTTIDGGTYTAYSGSTTSRGIYATAGTLDVSNVEISASGTTTAYGIDLSCGISDFTGFKYFADATLKNLTVTATTRTGNEADAVLMEVTKRPLSTTTYNALSSTNKTNYGAIYQYGEYAVGTKCSIIGGTYKATSAGTTAYGVRMNSAAICEDVNGDGELAIGAAELNIKNATFNVETKGGATAYGIWAGGPATVDNSTFTVKTSTSDAFGIRPRYGKTTISNSTIDVTAGTATARGVYVEAAMSAISTSSGTTHLCGVQGFEITGELESNNNTITAKANGGNTAYAIQVIDAKGSATQTTAEKGLAFAGDHACAGKATINGGKYTATASGTTAYAVIVSDPTVQGEATATPECIINDGKFYGYATGGTYADVSPNGETGYFVLNGGYYVKDENLDKKLGEGMNKVAVKSGTPEYTEGYRWRITDNMTGEAVCKIVQNSTSYASLEEALQVVNASPSSEWTIVMTANYTLSKGDYEIPANTTLLIPYKSSGTGKGATIAIGATPVYTYPNKNVEPYEAPTPLYKLTLANGVNITVKGTIEASAVTYLSNQGLTTRGTGIVSGKYGWLYLNEGSHIDLENGAALYAWGYVTGKGEINAKNGSVIYEDFQMGDWRGGTEESGVQGNENGLDKKGVFLLTHYYYQNIECPITYHAGAQGFAHGGTYMYKEVAGFAVANDPVPTLEAVKFIGTNGAMFLMDPATAGEDTWVRKEYDPETDYVNWTLNSGAAIGSVSIKMNLPMLGSMDVTSSNYVLPITSNFNIIANFGEIEITNHVCFIPGSKLTIKKEGIVTIPSGQKAFFYDQDNWLSYSGYWFNPGYSPSWKVNPRVATIGDKTKVKMPDAEVLVEGLLNINGAIYTTAGGANIHSTRENAGKVKFNVALPAATAATGETTGSTTLYQWKAGGPKYDGKALNPAWLKNENGSYSQPTSANTNAGDTWTYMQSLTEDTYEWTLASEDGCFTTRKTGDTKTYVHPSDWVAVSGANANHAYPSEDGTRMFVNTEAASTSASCKWWDVNPTPEVIDAVTYYVANNENFDNFGTYYYWDNSVSYWKPKKITVTWKDKDGNKITNGSFGDSYSFNTSPQFYGTNPTWANTSTEKHDWIGWRDKDGNIYDKNATLPVATGDVTYTAYFQTSKYQYTITFKNEDDNKVIWAGLMDAGDPAVCPVAPTQESTVSTVYTFSNWVGYAVNATLPTITGPATYTAHYTSSTRQYHVTFYNYDAVSVLYEADVDYNTRPVYDGVTPFRANTSAFSYEWTGWQQGATHYGTTDNLALVTGDVYYVATFSQTDLKYQVFFKRQDGSIIDAPFFNYEETPAAFPANPTLASTVSTDYTFDHWDPATLQPVTEDGKVYTALFDESPRQYTAHFVNYNGTSLNVDQTIDYNTVPAYTGATPFKPNDSRNSFEFAGWAWEAGADWAAGSIGVGEAFPAIKGDITFTAQFTETLLQFNVRYVRQDGTPLKEEKLKWGQSTTGFPSVSNYEDATHTYTFDHWSPATVVNPVTADATYTAYFNQGVKTYSISNFSISPAGYGTVSPASVTGIPGGSTITVNGNKITVNGQTATATPTAADAQFTYTFDHWDNVPATVTANVTNIEAVFTRTTRSYDVTFNMKGHGSAIDKQTITYNGIVTEPTPAPTDAAYDFEGWYKETACTNAWNFASDKVTGTTELFAKWTLKTYTITYNKGANGTGTVAAGSKQHDKAFTLSSNKFTRTGYTQTGWSTADGGAKAYDLGDPYTDNAAITLYPFWTINEYTVTWDATTNGGTCATASTKKNYNTEIGTLPVASKEGHTFNGWFTSATGGTQIAATAKVTADVTYYAQFTINKYSFTTIGVTPAGYGNVDVASITQIPHGSAVTVTGNKFTVNGTTVTATPTATTAEYTYAFSKWNDLPNTVTEDVTNITAVFTRTARSYTLSWVTDGDVLTEGYTSGTVAYGTAITAPNTPTKTGYVFAGWHNGTSVVTPATTMPAANTTYTAQWTAVTYSVRFNKNDEDATGTMSNESFTYDVAKALTSNAFTKTGYNFAGWATSAGGNVVYTDGQSVSNLSATQGAVVDMYAKWTVATYEVALNANGGTGGSTSVTMTYNSVDHTAITNPTRTGYTFHSWNTTASSSTRKQVISSKGVMSENVSGYTGVGGVWIRTTMPTTLYARWSQKSYTTTFTHNGNGSISYNGAVVDAGGTAKVYHVSAKSLVATPNTGYHFTGWTVSGTNASKVTIADLSAASTTIKATAASATVTAGFAPDEYTISYKDQGDAEFSGVHGSGYPTTHTYGTATVLVSPTKEGYTFDGWYDNAECAGTALTEIGATDYTADFTLYAKWTINKYKVTFDSNGGSAVSTIEQNYNTAVTAPADPTREGYTFAGWNPAVPSTMPVNGLTCVAQWNANPYTITFDSNGGSAVASITQNYGTEVTAPADPTREGYTFNGWSPAVPSTMPVNGLTCVAQWNANPYTITFDSNGGSAVASITQNYGTEVTAPAAPTREGYTFAGWEPAVPSTMPVNGLTCVAQWTINQYTLTVATNNAELGTVSGGGTYDYNTAHTITAMPKAGCKFVEWNDGNTNASRNVTVTADVTYTATFDYDIANYTVKHWQQNISDDNYTEVTGDQQVISGTIGAHTAAEAKNYTGFIAQPFEQQTIVVGGNTINIYYNRETYTITWKDGTRVIESAPESWRYGAKPSFDYQKAPTAQYTYTLIGWKEEEVSGTEYTPGNLPNVTSNATYIAQYDAVVRQYTITFVNDDNTTVLQSEGVNFAVLPAYSGKTPISTISDGQIRIFKGWTPDIIVVGGEATYTAVYDIQSILDVPGEETISVNTTVDVTTVHVAGKLTVNSGTLTTTDLILEGSEGASGEVIGEVTATNAYFDLSHAGGFKARTWYAVAVPWQVSVTAYAVDNGVYIKNGSDDPIRQTMGTTFDLIYYDGARRASGDTKAWNYVEDDQTKDKKHYTMEPGRAYMIYLTSDADVIRFERKEGAELHTTSIEAHKYGDENTPTTLANWNGIANPATYHAFLNVDATDDKGQTYNAETKGYDMFNMSTTPMVVGQPVFVQSAVEGTVVANSSSYSAAPRRAKAMTTPLTRYEILFAASEEDATDRIIVRMDEEKEENVYMIGQDLVKMGVSDRVPQMWIDRYDSKMCINTVAPINNTADYPLGISVQKDGEYDLFIDDQPNDETMLYLTYDGEAIWNLSYGGYVATLTKGTNTHYGLRIVYAERRTPTGIEEATIQNGESIRKVLVDDKVFIIRGNNVYSIDGQLVK